MGDNNSRSSDNSKGNNERSQQNPTEAKLTSTLQLRDNERNGEIASTTTSVSTCIQIYVKGYRKKIALEVEPSDTTENVKAKIQDTTGSPKHELSLFCGNKLLEDGRTLSYYNIQKESTLCWVKDGDWQIFVTGLEGRKFTINAGPSDIVESLKAKIQDKVGAPPDKYRVSFQGKPLQPGRTLSYFNIVPESTLNMILILRGGGYGDAEMVGVNVRVIVDGHIMTHLEDVECEESTTNPQQKEVDSRKINIPVTVEVDELIRWIIPKFDEEVPRRRRDPKEWDLFLVVDDERRLPLGNQGTLRRMQVDIDGGSSVEQILAGQRDSRLELKTPKLGEGERPQQPQQDLLAMNVNTKIL